MPILEWHSRKVLVASWFLKAMRNEGTASVVQPRKGLIGGNPLGGDTDL